MFDSRATVVLLTRYNMPSDPHENRIRATEGWLTARTELFERYTVPTVRSQTVLNRHWIVYLDTESPQWLKDRMATYAQEGLLTPVYRRAVSAQELRDDLAMVVPADTTRLITANLDNDDGLALDFVDRIKRMPVGEDRTALYLTRGLIRATDRLYWVTDRNNAFCAVSERWDAAVETCWADWHNRLGRTMQIRRESGPPAWLQVVHQRNVSNRVRGRLVSPAAYKDLFPESLSGLDEPRRRVLLYERLVCHPARAGRDSARAFAREAAVKLLGKDGLTRLKARLGR